MLDLSDVRAFARIAELGSISGAARALVAPKSSVSRSLSRLEQALGSVLVERATQRLHLTDTGHLFLPYALRILQEVEDAEVTLGRFAGVPRGTLRISAPFAFTKGALIPMLPGFLARYPEVNVAFEADAGWSSLATGDADLFMRVGPLPTTTMVARRLATVELWICASPAYLAARGSPASASALAAHDIVGLTGPEVIWPFRSAGGRVEEITLHTRAVLPDTALVQSVLAAAGGIGQLPDYMAADSIAKGELVRVLPEIGAATSDAFALFPSHHGLLPKARVFIDAAAAYIADRRAKFDRDAA